MPATRKNLRAARGEGFAEERSYQRLRTAITKGSLLPNERLVEADLAASLGVPRATVRTALVRLAQEHLVERLPNRGARVRRISEKEAVELLEARMELECLAARHAAKNATADDVKRLRSILATMKASMTSDPRSYAETNSLLHQEIVRIANHQTAERLLDQLRSRNTYFQFRVVMVPNDPRERFLQHTAIVAAIAAHNSTEAGETMRRHLSGVAERMRARLESGR